MYASDIKHENQSLSEKLHALYTLNRDKKIDLSFRPPFLRLLERLGNPHLHLPPIIHVAGTNGKGSIIAIIRTLLESNGYSVHSYTSPHLIEFNERITLAGKYIDNQTLEELIDEALELNAGGDLTFFEITTAIAFAAFARTPADICLLEVGMGGRLDCTNVITSPLLTIINTIGMDHAEHLGDSLPAIAAEKAGIMKQNIPCVIGPQNDEAVINVFKTKAKELNVPLHLAKPETHLQTILQGPHQKANLGVALTALELVSEDVPIKKNTIQTALNAVSWSARLQRLDPTKFDLPKTTTLSLDGGHNPDAGHALALWAKETPAPLTVILGMMQGKDTKGFIAPLLPHIDELFVVNIEDEPMSQSNDDLLALIPSAIKAQNFQDALKQSSNNHILICGSLYLAGHVLKAAQK